MIDILYAAALGLLMGLAFQRVAIHQVRKRSDNSAAIEAIDNPAVLTLWIVISAAMFALIFWKYDDTVLRIQNVLFISVAIDIAAVDMDIRKIPNEALLIILLARTGGIIAQLVRGEDFKAVTLPAALGLAVGLVIYSIPSVMKIPIGAGDIKYCGAIGYCLGIFGFLEAAIVMSIALLIYWIYLKISGKGSAKTVTMMGPYLSLGVAFSIIFPYAGASGLLSQW